MKNIKQPKISVIMSVYNGEEYLEESITSIINQTFIDFEFIIVNDGSTDKTGRILKKWSKKDGRIRIFEQENLGLTVSLNRALANSIGDFIARQDADDISLSSRLQKEFEFLCHNKDIGVCSSYTWIAGCNGENIYSFKYPTGDREIKDYLQKGINPITHGAVMFRKSLLSNIKDEVYRFRYAQDFDLWLRIAEFANFAIIPEILYVYKRRAASVSGGIVVIRRSMKCLMMQLCQERKENGEEILDWRQREAALFSSLSDNEEEKIKYYASGYFELLSKKQLQAFRSLWSNFRIKYIPLMILCLIPCLGWRLARKLHLIISPYKSIEWAL